MKKNEKKVPVSERAVIQRINRKLRPAEERLKKARTYNTSCGWFYIVDLNQSFLLSGHCDPEALARDLGVLQPWECVVAEGGA